MPRRGSLEGEHEADVVVLGAGLTGCLAALELARRGKRVLVLEAGSVAAGASGADVGHVATGLDMPYTEAVARYGREAAREFWETHRESHARLRELLEELGDDCGYRGAGGFRVALNRDEGRALAATEDLLREDGFSGEFLDHYMLEARFDVTGLAAAYWAADDGEIDTPRLVTALAAAAEERGAAIHEASAVLDLDLTPRGAEAVTARGRVRALCAVIALGANAPSHVTFLDERLRRVPARLLLLESGPEASLPSPARTCDGHRLWRATAAGLLVGGLSEGDVAPSLQAFARETIPGAGTTVLRTAAAQLDASADGLPLVGPLPGLPAVAACGFGGLGLSYAPLAARWAVQAALTGRDPTPPRFRAARAPGPAG